MAVEGQTTLTDSRTWGVRDRLAGLEPPDLAVHTNRCGSSRYLTPPRLVLPTTMIVDTCQTNVVAPLVCYCHRGRLQHQHQSEISKPPQSGSRPSCARPPGRTPCTSCCPTDACGNTNTCDYPPTPHHPCRVGRELTGDIVSTNSSARTPITLPGRRPFLRQSADNVIGPYDRRSVGGRRQYTVRGACLR
jgi:hypothetical protein